MALSLKTPKEIQREIASRLKMKRLEQNLTQYGLAVRSGVSLGSIKRFERMSEISLHSLLEIASVLNCLDECDCLFQNASKPLTLFCKEKVPFKRKRGNIK